MITLANEFDWIKSVSPGKHFHRTVETGIGDDAAVTAPEAGFNIVTTVDTMVEGIHFTRETMPLEAIGYKALAVNVSDLAAMGSEPLYYLVAIAVPKTGWTQEETSAIYSGMDALASQLHMDLIGGDTVSTKDALVITVTAIGKIEADRRLLRSNAEPGDVLFVTGELGKSAYGLEHLLERGEEAFDDAALAPYVQAHQYPVPQIEAGRLLAASGLRVSLNDISDGLGHEAKEIAEASGADVVIHWDKLPFPELFKQFPLERQEDLVLYGGEDFQLTGTVPASGWPELKQRFAAEGVPLFPVGNIMKGAGRVYVERDGIQEPVTKAGYHHF